MASDHIRINYWLMPFSWLYGIGVRFRNMLFSAGVLRSKSFTIPVISVGNITVGGTGKTPHVEYLVRLLKDNFKTAVLSRGYKRKSKGYVLADADATVRTIGDEPFQIHKKFPDIYVAVDKRRCRGIDMLCADKPDTDVVLLDDAFQHRYVQPGINILLIDYNRHIMHDKLLPAGRLREQQDGKERADVVIVTKCPDGLRPMDYKMVEKEMDLYPYQHLFFTGLEYGELQPLFCSSEHTLLSIGKDENILLLTGIASPQQMQDDLRKHCDNIVPLAFPDHHAFKAADIEKINAVFAEMKPPKIIVTTEKDAVRIIGLEGLSDEVRQNIYALPVRVKFMLNAQEKFNDYIISYVRKNSRNSILAKSQNDNKSDNRNNTGNRARTISFRNNRHL